MHTWRVEANECLAPRFYRLVLVSRRSAGGAAPGQFYMVRVGRGTDPLLPRPLAVYGMEARGGGARLTFVYEVIGRGTGILREKAPGDEVEALGPLGRGFAWHRPERPYARVIMVAGGIGLVPFLLLGRRLTEAGLPALYLYGARTHREVVLVEDFRALGVGMRVYTEDGSLGEKGLVTAGLTAALADGTAAPEDTLVCACGPWGMLEATATVAREAGAPCQGSPERRMACGMGACLSCVVRRSPGCAGDGGIEGVRTDTGGQTGAPGTRTGDAEPNAAGRADDGPPDAKPTSTTGIKGDPWLRTCQEGPVFATEEIDWEAERGGA